MLIASKVTVDPRMFEHAGLKGKRKTNLRRKIIIEYIAGKPAGTCITIPEFQKIGRFSTNANTHTFIKRMVRDGVISQYESERPRKYYYAVTGAVRVSKLPKPIGELSDVYMLPKASIEEIESKAKNYAWETEDDSLRGFIKYIKGEKVQHKTIDKT